MLYISIVTDAILFGILIPVLFILFSRQADGILRIEFHSPLLRATGFFMLVVGAVLIAWSYYLIVTAGKGYTLEFFRRSFLPVTERLVTRGPYSRTRHPMALGYLTVLLGTAFIINSVSGIFVIFPAAVIASRFYLKVFEERSLEERFKDDFREYRKKMNFLFPRVRMTEKR
jgi:protein-S-isoprenylcysteine O-methyltransferase Ste14